VGGGHELGQARLGPARLAHCMRWLGQIELALEMMVDRAQKRYAHGSYLSEKQAIQWMIAESGMELYASKLMVLHAAFKIENKLEFKTEVSYAKHYVANTLWRVIDRAVQVHGALGYSKDSPLSGMLAQARWSRFADGAEAYLSVKNVFDYRQPSPLVDPANPFGDAFDTAYVYGPMRGRWVMMGLRWGVGR